MPLNATAADQIRHFERRYARDPDSLVFARLADAYRKAGFLDRALEVVNRGLSRHPDYLNGRLVRARVLRDLGHREEAGRAFESVLEIDAQNLVALRALGDLAGESGRTAAARGWYERLLEVEPHAGDEIREILERLPTRFESQPGGAPPRRVTPYAAPPLPEGVPDVPSSARLRSESPEGVVVPEPELEAEREPAAAAAEAGPVEETEAAGVEAEVAAEAEVEAEVDAEVEELEAEVDAEVEELEAEVDAEVEELEAELVGDVEVEEVSPPPPDEQARPADLLTPTLAELYLKQGLYDEAIAMFERLLAARPNDPELAEKLNEARFLSQGGRGAARRRAARPKTVPPAAPESVDLPGAPEPADGPSIRQWLAELLDGRVTDGSAGGTGGESRFGRWLNESQG